MLLCTPITPRDDDGLGPRVACERALRECELAKAQGADLVELRIDTLASAIPPEGDEHTAAVTALVHLVAHCPLPCIVTCRSAEEGGDFDADDAQRVSLLERLTAASPHPPRYIDVEWSAYARSANLRQKVRLCVSHPAQLRDLSTGLILSLHDFAGRPGDLLRRALAMSQDQGVSVVKVACAARTLHDALEILDLPAHLPVPTIALAMGEAGVLTRVLGGKFGSLLTFAPLDRASSTAPGQVTLRELQELYRVRSITRATRVFGIVGDPVTHSLSPRVHNTLFKRFALDATYVPLPIAGYSDAQASFASLKAQLLELLAHDRLTLNGVSVTMPHKENLATLAQQQGWHADALTQITGAANTLLAQRTPAGTFATATIHNTDAPAIVDCLKDAGLTIPGARVAVVGAGGVGKAAAAALALEGATVVLYARSADKAAAAAQHLTASLAQHAPSFTTAAPGRIVGAALDLLPRACCDAFVQATPVGMAHTPHASAMPFDPASLTACASSPILLETIYAPRRTPLLDAAERQGWRTVDGLAMFVAQAARQATLFTGSAVSASDVRATLADV